MARPILVARIALAVKDRATKEKENASQDQQALLDQVINAADEAMKVVVTGDPKQAIDVAEQLDQVKLDDVAAINPELAYLVDAMHNAVDALVAQTDIDLEELEKLEKEAPDLLQNVQIKVGELPKLTSNDVMNRAKEALQVGNIAEARLLARLANEIKQIEQTLGSGAGSSGSGGTSSSGGAGGTSGGTSGGSSGGSTGGTGA